MKRYNTSAIRNLVESEIDGMIDMWRGGVEESVILPYVSAFRSEEGKIDKEGV